MRRLLLLVVVLLLAGAGLGYALHGTPPGGATTILLDGVPLDSGSQEVPPKPTLTVIVAGGARASDYRASIDGRAVAVRAGSGGASLSLPAMPQASWHHLSVWRETLGGGRTNTNQLAFRTAEPLRLAAAWLVGPASARVDVSWSRPLTDTGPVESALRAAGASVQVSESAVSGRWPSAVVGARLGFSLPAGLASSTGSYLAASFSPSLTLPADRPYSDVQVSGAAPDVASGLKLQAYYVGTAIGRADLAAHAGQIDVLTPDFYGLGGDGRLYSQVDEAALSTAAAAGIEVQPLVTNLDFDAGKAHDLISSPGGADLAAANLVAEAKARSYTGYQLDFENMRRDDRAAFTAFSSRLAKKLTSAGLKYSLAVVPRKASAGVLATSQYSAAYDYPSLSNDSRWLTMMAYDQHTSGTGPGAVAALDWVRDVMAGGSAGVDPARVYLGAPLYYREWTIGGDTTVGPYSEAIQKAIDNGAGIGWDFAAATAFIRYSQAGAEHILWMDNRASLAEKIGVAKQMGFAGVSVWRLGFEDPGFWDLWLGR
ncbi:MAG TPA: glycosyl hydrolase family 18 protein [Candidatus Solibacter sp.]|jgi:spore germination protein|nr:glycosyl hydrolase family 18 protein [Candidatus Solibacter sp.]